VPAKGADSPSSLEDYLDLLEVLSGLGVESVVIGGCAVGAYARLIGETVFSGSILQELVSRAPGDEVRGTIDRIARSRGFVT